MAENFDRRRCHTSDDRFSHEVTRRIITYWLANLLFVVLALAMHATYQKPQTLFVWNIVQAVKDHWAPLVAATTLFPFMMNDVMRFAHRYVGPLRRVRSQLRKCASGGHCDPISIRRSDSCADAVEAINELLAELAVYREKEEQAEIAATIARVEDESESHCCV